MNTQSDGVPESAMEAQGIAPAVVSRTRPLYWSVRRELWENRSIYVAPLAVAGVTVFGYLIALIHLPRHLQAMMVRNPTTPRVAVEQPYDFAAGLVMGTALIVAIFYCLDALHGERRDRSILFWKSMPVSDLNAVLAKALIPLLVLPLLSWGITVAEHWVMFVLNVTALVVKGQSPAALWAQLPLFHMELGLLYHLFTMHVLWHAPIYAYLIMVSGWARRATFLWAFLPPLAISILEKILFNTAHFAHMIQYRLAGDPALVASTAGTFPFDEHMTHLSPIMFLATPSLWTGLVVAALFLYAAVQLRRCQGPI